MSIHDENPKNGRPPLQIQAPPTPGRGHHERAWGLAGLSPFSPRVSLGLAELSLFSPPPPGPLETGGAQAVSGPQLAWGLAELDYLSPPPGSLGTGGTQLFSPRVSPQVPWGTGVTPAL